MKTITALLTLATIALVFFYYALAKTMLLLIGTL